MRRDGDRGRDERLPQDVSDYLIDGENTIVIDYSSVLSNVQLDRGEIQLVENKGGWWGYDVAYLDFGPKQAKIVPFVDIEYGTLDVETTPRTLAGKVYLSVSAMNNASVPADIVITTPYGDKTFKAVAPGKSVAVSVNSRLPSVPAGEATITATSTVDGESTTETRHAPFAAYSAGR